MSILDFKDKAKVSGVFLAQFLLIALRCFSIKMTTTIRRYVTNTTNTPCVRQQVTAAQ